MSSTRRRTKMKNPPRAARKASSKRSPARGAPATKARSKAKSRPSSEEVVNADLPAPVLFPAIAVTRSAEKSAEAPGLYDPEQIVDAPEHHAISRALGVLTWDIWDHDIRPESERKRDFVTAFPPRNPTAFSLGGTEQKAEHEWLPRTRDRELERFLSRDGRAKGIDALLARYGLKLKDAPPLMLRTTPIRDALQAARERNHGLRVLHGSVDIEPKDMDSAKSAFVEQQEKRRAAEEIRAARKRLEEETKRPDES